MNSKDLLKAGMLAEARKQLTEEVKSSPGDPGKRTLLFQTLAFYGEWDKAEKHLDAIAAQDSSRESGVQLYKNLVHAERQRSDVMKLGARPSFVSSTPPYLDAYFAAIGKLAENRIEEAEELFEAVSNQRPAVSGVMNGKKFKGFQDADSSLSFFLEAMVYERYVWAPFESIRELAVSPPQTLMELLWAKALITTWDGLSVNCYLPVLYPDSWRHPDDRVKLGRMTDWTPLGGPFSKGAGRHLYLMGEEALTILDITEIQFKRQGGKTNNEEGN